MFVALGVCAAVAFAGGAARATPITYTLSGTASGSLNGTAFTGALFGVTFVSDTANVTDVTATIARTAIQTGVSFTVGASSGTFTDPLYVFDNREGPSAGFTRGAGDILTLGDVGFGTYNMRTGFDPTVSATVVNNAVTAIPTSAGALTFTSVSAPAFRAVLGQSVVPEAGTLGLLGLGASTVVCGVLRRRIRVA